MTMTQTEFEVMSAKTPKDARDVIVRYIQNSNYHGRNSEIVRKALDELARDISCLDFSDEISP